MTVRIGSARHDENGKYVNGRAGDQDGTEVSTQNFYLHSKGWRILRAKDTLKRQKIADCMQWSCDNQLIGYDQNQRDDLYLAVKDLGFDVRKLTKAVETDCSALVRVCVNYAGIKVGDFHTGNEADVLLGTGAFDEIQYTAEDDLMRGDVLVTKKKGHTVIVLNDGTNVSSAYPKWIHLNGKWYYRLKPGQNAHGWRDINKHRYYFKPNGEMVKDWFQIDGKRYYFQPDGDLEGALYRSDETGAQMIWEL